MKLLQFVKLVVLVKYMSSLFPNQKLLTVHPYSQFTLIFGVFCLSLLGYRHKSEAFRNFLNFKTCAEVRLGHILKGQGYPNRLGRRV